MNNFGNNALNSSSFSALAKVLSNAKVMEDISSQMEKTSRQLQEINVSLEEDGTKLAHATTPQGFSLIPDPVSYRLLNKHVEVIGDVYVETPARIEQYKTTPTTQPTVKEKKFLTIKGTLIYDPVPTTQPNSP